MNFINMYSVLPLDLTLCFCQSFYWRLSLCMYSYVSEFICISSYVVAHFILYITICLVRGSRVNYIFCNYSAML